MGRVKEELFDKYQADQKEEQYFKALEKAKDWEEFCDQLMKYHDNEVSWNAYVYEYTLLKEKYKC